jgi:hypothetical protein
MMVRYTLEELSRADSNGLKLYGTPGAERPYWSATPSFMYDEVVATVGDFAEAAGLDDFGFETGDGQQYLDANGNETFSLEIEMPPRD